MSYQIKRTPYFRRIFNNSRRNGQLQRLREEYERIQEFNDRTIELKMRQVRLKRLFREIEDINESPSTSNAQHLHSTLVPLSPEVMQAQQRRERLEALERARELGQEISRRNAQLAESESGYYLRGGLRLNVKMQAVVDARREAQERRQRAARRISYGNAQSRSNIERILQRRQRRLMTGDTPSTTIIVDDRNQVAQLSQLPQSQSSHSQLHPDHMKRAMLQQRLEYGNSRSSNNMLRSRLAATHRVLDCMSANDEIDQQQREENLQQQQQHQEQEPQRSLRQQRYNNRSHYQRQLPMRLPLLMQQEPADRKPLGNAQLSPSSSSNITNINGGHSHDDMLNNLTSANNYSSNKNYISDNDTLCNSSNNDHDNTNNNSSNGNIDSNNIDLATNNDSSNGKPITDTEVEMHTAMVPSTELELMLPSSPGTGNDNDNNVSNDKNNYSSRTEENNIRNSDDIAYDDIPTTSHKALRLAEAGAICQHIPLAGPGSNALLDSAMGRKTAAEHWHRVSLTLPWIKIMHDLSMSNESTSQSCHPANMRLAVGANALGTNSSDRSNINSSLNNDSSNNNNNSNNYNDVYDNGTTSMSVTTTDNYHSIRGPSLMQEDLMQVMELDDNGEMPAVHIAHHSYSNQ